MLLTLCCAATTTRAQDGGNPANWCRNGAFARDSESFGLARVKGEKGSRVYFYGEEEGCPAPPRNAGRRLTSSRASEVITSRTFGDWVCAWFQPARGTETVGWLAAERLGPVATAENAPLASWLGTWNFYNNSVRWAAGGAWTW